MHIERIGGPARAALILLLAFGPAPAAPLEEAKPDTAALISAVAKASPAERPRRVHELAAAGASALEETRKARDAATDADLRSAYARAAVWQLASKIAPRLREGFESQLTYDGQYDDVAGEGSEVTDALLAVAEDAASAPALRLAAFRAIADVAGHRDAASRSGPGAKDMLARLRKIYHDPLLPQLLKEQAGFLLAIFGDTHAVDARIAKFERQSKTLVFKDRLESHLELAELYYRIRNYERAVRSYDEILSAYEKILEDLRRGRAPKEAMERARREYALQLYNAACSSSLGGRVEKAKDLLRKAIEIDPIHFTNMQKDGDLANLRKDPGYAEFRRSAGKRFDKEEL